MYYKDLTTKKSILAFSNNICIDGQKIETPLSIAKKFNNHFFKTGKIYMRKSNLFYVIFVSIYATVLVHIYLNPTSAIEIHCVIS